MSNNFTDPQVAVSTAEQKSRILSQQYEKFWLAKKVTEAPAVRCSEGGMADFSEKLQFLQNVSKSRNYGEKTAVAVIEQENNHSQVKCPYRLIWNQSAHSLQPVNQARCLSVSSCWRHQLPVYHAFLVQFLSIKAIFSEGFTETLCIGVYFQ